MWQKKKKHEQKKYGRKKDFSQHCTSDKNFTYQTWDNRTSSLEKGNNASHYCLITQSVEPLHTHRHLLWHKLTTKIFNVFNPQWTYCTLKRAKLIAGSQMTIACVIKALITTNCTNICWQKCRIYQIFPTQEDCCSNIFYHK